MNPIEQRENQEPTLVETVARVVAIDEGGIATMVAERRSACESCAAKSGCGVSSLSGVFGNRAMKFSIPTSAENTHVGDDYVIAMPQALLLKIAVMTYMIPIVVMIAAAAIASGMGGSDAIMALVAGVGLIAGFLLARLLVNRPAIIEGARPTILHPVSQDKRQGMACHD